MEKNSNILLQAASILEIPVIVTEQYPKGLGSTANSLKTILPNETHYFEKNTFSALDNLDIMDALEKYNKKQIVLFGIETHICVNQTAYSLIEKGYDVNLVTDICGSRSEKEHHAGIERIKSHGANIITTEMTLFEWLKSSKHQMFKELKNGGWIFLKSIRHLISLLCYLGIFTEFSQIILI